MTLGNEMWASLSESPRRRHEVLDHEMNLFVEGPKNQSGVSGDPGAPKIQTPVTFRHFLWIPGLYTSFPTILKTRNRKGEIFSIQWFPTVGSKTITFICQVIR